jgi:ectoine hydroxylase-related dioxygenase (phytanoyl-CoA dioxygenase family)
MGHSPADERSAVDRNSPTGGRCLALADQEVVGYEPLMMAPGDLAVFYSYLLHSSGDNTTDEARAALCFDFAAAGTIDGTTKRFGLSPFNDSMSVWRRGGPA